MLKTIALTPALTPILRDRKSCLAIATVAGAHTTLTILGLPSWECPVRYGLGIPCPGCGLSRAVAAISHGQMHEAFQLHAFAPVLIIGLLIILTAGILPTPWRDSLAHSMEWLERNTGMVVFILLNLVGYWLIRLLFFTEDLYELVM